MPSPVSASATPLFVLSTGRAGTNYLQRLLRRADGAPDVPHQQAGARLLNVVGTASFQLGWPALAERALRAVRGEQAFDSTADPLLTMALLQALPARGDHTVLHLVRDPRDFVRSFVSWKRQSAKRTVLHHAVPLWQPNPFLAGDAGFADSLAMRKFERFAWVWAYKNRAIIERFSDHPNYHRFRLEDLTHSERGPAETERLLGALGLDATALAEDEARRPVNKSRDLFPPWRDWTPRQAAVLHRHAGGLMDTLGYGGEPAWLDLLHATSASTAHPALAAASH